jgi:2-polyprenyl-6-methoxyphenol hydroxylase-like FAD-dependent oxidoreductase
LSSNSWNGTVNEASNPVTIPSNVKRVVIVGAGPAGLLSAIHLLRRNDRMRASNSNNNNNNNNNNTPRYHVTIVDPGTDYGALDETGLKRHRSWMIGLSAHGLNAIRNIDGLYEHYVQGIGISTKGTIAGIGKLFQFEAKMPKELQDQTAFCVDRNYMCAALARYLNEHYMSPKTAVPQQQQEHQSSSSNSTATTFRDDMDTAAVTATTATTATTPPYKELQTFYNTRALFVDVQEQCLMVRRQKEDDSTTTTTITSISSNSGDNNNSSTTSTSMVPIPYDILLACDGVRSIVRNAFVTHHRDFEFSMEDNFNMAKSIHITRPKTVQHGYIYLLSECVPNVISITIPERGDQLNFACGYSLNAPCDEALHSTNPTVISKYMKEQFSGHDLDFEEFGKRWVEQPWFTTGQVHCNFYHSTKINALLLGDAAHATVPNIGQGMNTALADAKALDDIMDQCNDDWELILPMYSKERVKEGNALTDLSFHSFSHSNTMQAEIMIRQALRKWLHNLFPTLVSKEPMQQILLGKKLSEAYHEMIQLGYFERSRRINQDIKRQWFERKVGMVQDDDDDDDNNNSNKSLSKEKDGDPVHTQMFGRGSILLPASLIALVSMSLYFCNNKISK